MLLHQGLRNPVGQIVYPANFPIQMRGRLGFNAHTDPVGGEVMLPGPMPSDWKMDVTPYWSMSLTVNICQEEETELLTFF